MSVNAYLWVSMPLHVHLRKRTNIANTNNINGEMSEEIHDIQSFVAQIKTQKERGYYRADQLLDHVFLYTNKRRYSLGNVK